MPKARRSAAQKAASRANLAKARAARRKPSRAVREARARGDSKLIPHGKTRLLFHSTTPTRARKILQSGFKAKRASSDSTGTVFFANRKGHISKGSVTLKVRLPRKAVIHRHTRRFDNGTEWVEAAPKSLRDARVSVASNRRRSR